jgi:hypothetical protein
VKNRILYFPYIRVPESTWLTQVLLYWDQVSSIVPYEFTQRPDSLGRIVSLSSLLYRPIIMRQIREVGSHMTRTRLHRWDEKAGLQRDAIRSQCSTCSRHKEKETGYEKD